ncbi:MAG: CDP-diacylglycerol diphosphatase [Janthinobacterium lividum]
MFGLAYCAGVNAGRDALREIVMALPVAADSPAPSPDVRVVDHAAGYVIKKDLRGVTHFLLLPLARIDGLEAPALREAGAIPYFAHAWHHRGLVAQAGGAPLRDEQLGVVINPLRSRTQDHLHLHLDQVLPELTSQLAAHGPTQDLRWEAMVWNDRVLQVLRIPRAEFAGVNPFRLFDDAASLAGIELEALMLLLTSGADQRGAPVFYLVAGRYGEMATGGWDFENLMVHQPPPAGASRASGAS